MRNDGCMRQLAAAVLNVGAEYSILIERVIAISGEFLW